MVPRPGGWHDALHHSFMISPVSAMFSYLVSALSEKRVGWVVDEGVSLLGAGSRNICIALHRVTAPFLCEVEEEWSLSVTEVRTVLPLGH